MADQQYLALYRKYRPMTFEDVRGRDAIVRTLRNQILTGRISHSYLFCGTRGTGKTTIAKIFARAVNCEHPVDGSPCGTCASCLAIERNADLNVAELDAASNNGVEDVRGIIDQVAYSPTQGRYRVFILDEAHMLSQAASNALLKTLEEPPSYAIFILATTEPNRLPVTILSRCQRFDFGRLPLTVIADRLREIADREGLDVEDRALRYMASAADGSMRDGLSLLDQCNAFNYGGDTLTYERTLEILGAVDTAVFSRMYRCLRESRVMEAVQILDEILLQGRELVQFATDFTWYLRGLMLLKGSEMTAASMDVTRENLDQMIRDARNGEMEEIMRYIRIFSGLLSEIRFSSSRRILTEMAVIRACRPAMDGAAPDGSGNTPGNLAARVQKLEERLVENEHLLSEGRGTLPVSEGEEERPRTAPAPRQMSPEEKRMLAAAVPEDIRGIVASWEKLIADLPRDRFGAAKSSLMGAYPSLGENGTLLVVFPDWVTGELFQRNEQDQTMLADYLSERCGSRVTLEIRVLDNSGQNKDNYPDLRELGGFDKINMDVETEDE